MNGDYYQFYYFSTKNRGWNPQSSELLITPKDKRQIHETSYSLYCGAFLDNAAVKNKNLYSEWDWEGTSATHHYHQGAPWPHNHRENHLQGEKVGSLPWNLAFAHQLTQSFTHFWGPAHTVQAVQADYPIVFRAAECNELQVGLHHSQGDFLDLSVQHSHPQGLVPHLVEINIVFQLNEEKSKKTSFSIFFFFQFSQTECHASLSVLLKSTYS